MATLLMRPGDGGSGDKKRRARKGKNAQKKLPQRGLGVAQLEKLRLQEQSLLCPTPPSYMLRLSAADSDHHMVRCNTDAVSKTVLSLTTCNVHGQAGGGSSTSKVVGGAEPGTLSRLSALNVFPTTQSSLPPHLAHDMSKGNGAEAFHAAAKRAVASRALACLTQTSKFSSVNASLFTNVLTAAQLQMLESQAQAQQIVAEERRAPSAPGEVEHSENATTPFIFPSVNNYLKEVLPNQVNNNGVKLHSLFKDHVGASASIGRTNSVKELSSFQSYVNQQAWPSVEKVAGKKRPWLAVQENSRHVCYAQALDLNAPVEENDAGERRSLGSNQVPEFRVGAHYTTGIVRTALGNSSLPPVAKIKLCSSGSYWQEHETPSQLTAYLPEVGAFSENGTGLRHCRSQTSIKDSCSSATGPSSDFYRDRQTSFKDPPKMPSPLAGKESCCSNFLTLGISSSSYPDRNGWNEPEESIQDTPTSVNNGSRFRQQEATTTSGGDGDNHCSQEVGRYDLKGDSTQSLSLDYGAGGLKRKSSMLQRDAHMGSSSHYDDRSFPSSLTPPSIASCNPSNRSKPDVEEILDLRLKLAL